LPIISKKARYAFHGLGYIARFSNGSAVPFDEVLAYLKEYAPNLTLSSGYIAKIFQSISRAGIIESVSGPSGGYRIARDPATIPLLEVVEALDGPLASGCCLLSVGSCPQNKCCGVNHLVHECEMIFIEFLDNNSVATVADRMSIPETSEVRAEKRTSGGQIKQAPLRARG
jgi:Rrf2 family protein